MVYWQERSLYNYHLALLLVCLVVLVRTSKAVHKSLRAYEVRPLLRWHLGASAGHAHCPSLRLALREAE